MLRDFIRTTKLLLIGSVLLAVGAANLSAALVTGSFGTTNSGVMTFANAMGTHFLDWCPTDPASPAGSTCTGLANYGKGDIAASGGSGTFSGLPTNPGPANGTIKDITDGTPPTGAYSYLPVGPLTTNLNNFITLALYPTLNFRAFNFVPTSCLPSATQLCAGGFVLNQIGPNVFVAISVTGTVWDTTTPTLISTFTDAISGQYNNTTMLAVATAANTTGGVFSNTWSQSIQVTAPAATPEPGTFVFLGSGLLLLLPLARRRRK